MLTNYYKIAMLPLHLFNMAQDIVELYEDGELIPPSDSKQRQRRSISPSSFNFLRGLNPRNEADVHQIEKLLTEWSDTGIRPSPISSKVHYSQKFCTYFTAICNM